jgi:hypothetical protein
VISSMALSLIAIDFFAPRFEEATKVGSRMIKAIQEARASS